MHERIRAVEAEQDYEWLGWASVAVAIETIMVVVGGGGWICFGTMFGKKVLVVASLIN